MDKHNNCLQGSVGQEDPLEEGMATHSNILAWRILWTEEPGRPQSVGLHSQTQLKQPSMHTHSRIKSIRYSVIMVSWKERSVYWCFQMPGVLLLGWVRICEVVYFPNWLLVHIFPGIPQQRLLQMQSNTVSWRLVASRGSLMVVECQRGCSATQGLGWQQAAWECCHGPGGRTTREDRRCDLGTLSALSTLGQESSFLISPDLEMWMAHVFGWLPSQDILKPCPRSFSGTVVLV